MSENITILEGGKAENFGQIAKLRTSNGSGYDLWVPESDVDADSLSVKKNGLYYTREYIPTTAEFKDKDSHYYEDVYGWDTVTVSVEQKVTGKKRGTDKMVTVEVDDKGNLVETEAPAYIRIVQPPSKTSYIVAQPISISGIVVKAYHADGSEWGTVPVGELSWSPVAAIKSQGDIYSDGEGVNAVKISCTKHKSKIRVLGTDYLYDSWCSDRVLGNKDGVPVTLGTRELQQSDDSYDAILLVTRYNDHVYAKRLSGSSNNFGVFYKHASPYDTGNGVYTAIDDAYVYNLAVGGGYYTTSEFKEMAYEEYITEVPTSTKNPENAGRMIDIGGGETVTVSWTYENLPAMTDTYSISVSDPPSPI